MLKVCTQNRKALRDVCEMSGLAARLERRREAEERLGYGSTIRLVSDGPQSETHTKSTAKYKMSKIMLVKYLLRPLELFSEVIALLLC